MQESSPAAEPRRDLPRQECTRPNALALLVRPGVKRFQAELRDVSRGGVAFWLDEPLKPGTALALQRVVRGYTGSWVRSGRVAHCTPAGGQFLIGCLLSPPFTEDELRALA